jgi:hypothetical protein
MIRDGSTKIGVLLSGFRRVVIASRPAITFSSLNDPELQVQTRKELIES